jgi:hypothetical protein
MDRGCLRSSAPAWAWHIECMVRGFPTKEETAMAWHHERYAPESDDHGIGDIARRNAESDYREQFGTGRQL